jgi:hypothetical protein
MERNAFTLVTLLQQLNQRMQAAGSTEKIVVIGPSMGGQIARYALAYMEKNNLAHNTRLFISLDSPHNGATIPLGLQHFVDYFADATEDATTVAARDQLDSPAARELVQHHYGQGTAFAPDPLRTQFMRDLGSFGGYPSQLRRVAVANGALDGAGQVDQNGRPILAGQQAFGMEQRGVPSGSAVGIGVRVIGWMGLLARQITLASARVYYAPGNGQTQTVLESFYITKGRHTQEATGPGGSCGLDGAPGGYRDFFASLGQQNSKGVFQMRRIYSLRDKACFIPTLSALGYLPTPANYCQPAGQALVCAGTTPFDAYYGPTGHNEDHVQLTPGNVDFIRNEILLKTPTPVFSQAPSELCAPSGPITFGVVSDCAASRAGQSPAGTTYTWTPGPGLQVVSGQGTATVQVASTTIAATTSYLEVVAVRLGYAASPPVRVPVYVGPTVLGSITTNGDCAGSTIDLTVDNHNVNRDFHWSFGPSLAPDARYDGQSSIQYRLPTSGPRFWPIQVTATDKCNASALVTYKQEILVTYDAGCANYRLAAPAPQTYPNPADGSLTVVEPTKQKASSPQTAILYNVQGQQVRRLTTSGELKMATADLPPGLYLLVVQQEGQVTKCHVQIQH